MPIPPTLSPEQYAIERAACDAANAAWQRITGGKRNYITAEEAQDPAYAACDNAMRGRVEQFEILTNPPESFVAYMGEPDRQATNYVACRPWPVTTWTGNRLGYARCTAKWRVRSWTGSHMHQFRAQIAEREYTGRGFGEGMCVVFRETAESKRKRM